jgi:hypothetical protein
VLNPGFASQMRTRRSLKRVPTRSGLQAVTSLIALLKLAAIAGSSGGAEVGSLRHSDARAGARATEACV